MRQRFDELYALPDDHEECPGNEDLLNECWIDLFAAEPDPNDGVRPDPEGPLPEADEQQEMFSALREQGLEHQRTRFSLRLQEMSAVPGSIDAMLQQK